MSSGPSRRPLSVFLAACALASVAVYVYFRERGPAPEPEPPPDKSAFRQLVSLKNDAVALLENAQFAEAAEKLREITQRAPDERLGWQNLAIALLLTAEKVDRARETETIDRIETELREVLAQLRQLDPDDPESLDLSARFLMQQNDYDGAIRMYAQAGKRRDADPAILYAGLEMSEWDREQVDPQQLNLIVENLRGNAPDNLAANIAVMKHLGERRDPGLKTAIDSFRTHLVPLSPTSQTALGQYLDAATAAVDGGNWTDAITQITNVRNLLLGEIAFTNDLHRLQPHLLERVVLEFSPEFYAPHAASDLDPGLSIPVAFAAVEWPAREDLVTAIAAEDFDLDGKSDLILAVGTLLEVWSNPFDAARVKLVDAELPWPCSGIATGDLDGDYQSIRSGTSVPFTAENFIDTDLDIVIYGEEGVRVFRNDLLENGAGRTLSYIPQTAEFDALRDVTWVEIADLNHDGPLDLAIVADGRASIWFNDGRGTFRDVSANSSLPGEHVGLTQLRSVDLNRDVLIDLLAAAPTSDDGLVLSSSLHGRFRATSVSDPAQSFGASRCVVPIEANQDATWDVLSAGERGVRLTLMKSLTKQSTRADRSVVLSEVPSLGVAVWDYDNDGFMDAVSWGESGIEIFRGDGRGNFAKSSQLTSEFPQQVSSVVVFDADADGDQDLACLSEGRLVLLRNDGGNANGWIDVRMRAEEVPQNPRERCNMHGVGNLLELKVGDIYQSLVATGTSTHFGLGSRERADVVRILWTNGIPQNVIAPEKNRPIFEQQILAGSCPYLYAWDGTQFTFVTDCLWAAPIGLQFAEGVPAPCRNWEYLKIDGDLLQPLDGEYVLQLTEELWEIAYYDHVSLLAVDHPAEIDIFTNEKVGPAEIAEFRVYTVRNRRTPKVLDSRGNEITDIVATRDRTYHKGWERSFTQGLVEEHWIELDLGDLSANREIILYLTGWMLPASTSINVANTYNPDSPRARPPALLVPDKDGNWIEALPYMGFPGGKTKTIAVDVSGLFPTDDWRVRIATNLEICWDEVFFTADDEPGEYRLTEMPLQGADLHYRGYSRRIRQPGNGPEFYDYADVTTSPVWPPIGGAMTRYGDVLELLREPDDRQAVFATGDEMTVRFAATGDPPPPGWKRDFILYNIGWDKDADLNTIQGQQVEPLPFRAMTKYPYAPDESFPDTPLHRKYLEEYQTRRQPIKTFWTLIRDWKAADLGIDATTR